MTDKQIIIDGVNVAECPHRKKEVTFMNVIKCYNYGACEGVNCLYKQLKRKEQDCEKLHKQLKQAEHNLAEKDKEIERLKQGIKHYQRGMFSIINTATECRNNKQWNYK